MNASTSPRRNDRINAVLPVILPLAACLCLGVVLYLVHDNPTHDVEAMRLEERVLGCALLLDLLPRDQRTDAALIAAASSIGHLNATAFLLDRNDNATIPATTDVRIAQQAATLFSDAVDATAVQQNARDSRGVRHALAGARLKSTGDILVFHYPSQTNMLFAGNKRPVFITGLLLVFGGIAMGWYTRVRRLEKRLAAEKTHVEQLQLQLVDMGKLAAMGELSAGIAHEINNPLAIMMENSGWIQDLLSTEEIPSPETRTEIETSLQTIVTQGHRCREITHKLLSFARKSETTRRVQPVNAILEDIVGYARQKTKHTRVRLLAELEPEAGGVLASPAELQQIILNLVNNAIDALDAHEGCIQIRSMSDAEYVRIEVHDTGKGIPKDVFPRIFEPFYTTKQAGKGTGLGLSICRDLIDKMGGDISAESAPDTGTTFRIRLPRQDLPSTT